MDGIPYYLESWIREQRWYGGKSRAPRFEMIGGFRLDDRDGEVDIIVQLVLDHAENPALYQVPITGRRSPLANAEDALIAKTDDADGPLWLYDGPHDPAFARALLELVVGEEEALDIDDPTRIAASGHRDPSSEGIRVRSSRVLRGEQSNTSIVYDMNDADGATAPPVICKLFRALHDGENPDVVLTGVLGSAGSAVVPRVIGHATGHWKDRGKLHGVATGHLAFAQEFLAGTQDAWRVALRAADVNEDFTELANALGVTTAVMHETLASSLPSRTTTPADIALIISSMRERFEIAAREVPELEIHRAELENVYERAAASPWLALQRVHGDYHLGQVLSAPSRGWVVLDFEGEPMRPMRERSLPDIPLRDVAGMLRSFDYVAGSVALDHPGRSVATWASACRHAFLDGYISRSGSDLRAHRAVLDAFEIDKALYEAAYEARNRPSWLSIPIDAITRLLERAANSPA